MDPYDDFDSCEHNPLSLLAKSDQDTMYLDQALKAPDRAQFIEAMKKEVATHEERGHWKLVARDAVPTTEKVLDAVWSMKRKRRIRTQEVYKWKARLNVHGGQMIHGVHYWETFSPVVTWGSIRLILILSILFDWHTRQLDFVLAFPQADVNADIYMNIPKGFNHKGDHRSKVLKLLKNLYGSKDAGRTWNRHLHKHLIEMKFKQSKADECVYFRDKTIFLVYVDDGILAGPDEGDINQIMTELSSRFELTDEGDLSDYLGVNIDVSPDKATIKLSQPHLVDQILKELNFREDTKPCTIPAKSSVLLKRDLEGEDHNAHWSYRRIIGKLNFLEKSSRPELAVSVHSCARFSHNPKRSHAEAVHDIGRYLVGTPNEGIIMQPKEHSFEVWADADFCGAWDHQTAMDDPATAKSRSGYIIMYAGCPVLWKSAMQPLTALSTTEAEYISLSQALRDTIPLMTLTDEIRKYLNLEVISTPTVKCTAFGDNSGAVEIANVPKMRPRTKHLNCRYHHFRSYVTRKLIKVLQVGTEDMLADICTKNLGKALFLKFRKLICGY